MIVPTDGRLLKLISKLGLKDNPQYEEKKLEDFMSEIISSIGTEQDASLNLAACALDFVGNFIYFGQVSDEAADFANILVELGEVIISNMKDFGIYSSGHLRYQYHSRMIDDVVLSRIEAMDDSVRLCDVDSDCGITHTSMSSMAENVDELAHLESNQHVQNGEQL